MMRAERRQALPGGKEHLLRHVPRLLGAPQTNGHVMEHAVVIPQKQLTERDGVAGVCSSNERGELPMRNSVARCIARKAQFHARRSLIVCPPLPDAFSPIVGGAESKRTGSPRARYATIG